MLRTSLDYKEKERVSKRNTGMYSNLQRGNVKRRRNYIKTSICVTSLLGKPGPNPSASKCHPSSWGIYYVITGVLKGNFKEALGRQLDRGQEMPTSTLCTTDVNKVQEWKYEYSSAVGKLHNGSRLRHIMRTIRIPSGQAVSHNKDSP
jgi:hypothetical protein